MNWSHEYCYKGDCNYGSHLSLENQQKWANYAQEMVQEVYNWQFLPELAEAKKVSPCFVWSFVGRRKTTLAIAIYRSFCDSFPGVQASRWVETRHFEYDLLVVGDEQAA